ncbi:MAG: hypothetical protein DMG61_08580 [Acidobacteria bacterium]|nr:MAG: hypothetical protein DMG61_08580 [Acidobacteriota bacterium]
MSASWWEELMLKHTRAHERQSAQKLGKDSIGHTFSERAAVLLVLLSFLFAAEAALAQANVLGQWQTLPSTMPINPVHVALLRTGKVLVVSGSGNVPSNTNYQAGIWDPATGTVTTQPLAWDMFCNGMVILSDGRPFVVGGTLAYDPFHGYAKSAAYDPSTGQFTDLESMAHGRWYPSATTLGDGTVMAFSGLSETGPTNTAVEIYTVGSGWSQEYPSGWTPPLYPRLHLLPNGNVFYSGPTNSSMMFDSTAHTWSYLTATNYSSGRTYGSSVLLPLTPANGYRPRVMIFGGGNPATATTEIMDLSAATPTWQWGPPMSQPRIEMNAVLLPTGKVLALGGSTNDEDAATASLNADLFDADGGSVSSAGQNAFPRLYHSVAILLQDGRVFVAGGNPTRGTYEPHMEVYSPAYLFAPDGSLAPRPTVTGVSSSAIGYGTTFQVQTPDATSITSAVLMRAGAVTHAFDMEQRLVGMSFTAGGGVLTVTAPPNGNIAPPGYYLLFLLNSAGVPSVGTFVQISPSAQPGDFSFSASPATQTVVASRSTTYTISVSPIAGFTGTVSMSVSGLPAGSTATFNPQAVSGAGSSTLTVNTGVLTPLGNYPLTITGVMSI